MQRFVIACCIAIASLSALAAQAAPQRTIVSLNEDWRFQEGDIAASQASTFYDASWELITIPHIFPFTLANQHKSLYRGEAWYRKAFVAQEAWKGQRAFLRFDAVGITSDLFLNGQRLGEHRGGFAAFTYEVTGKLHIGAVNQLAVRVDNRLNPDVSPLEASLLYGGIYRNVSLILTAPVDITPLDYSSPGVFLKQSSVSPNEAVVEVRTEVNSALNVVSDVTAQVTIIDASGKPILRSTASSEVMQGPTKPIMQTIVIPHPHLWNGVADPYLYSARVDLLIQGNVIDTVTQPLGLRTFHVDPQHGFVLNGMTRQIHGVCLHQDWGDKGWAIGPKEEEQDLATLRAMGVEGLRLVHYQHSQSALDLYDRTGILVWSELAQFGRVSGTEAYHENVREQLKEMIRQNYNHPSIVMWSLFNELNSATKSLSLPIVKDLNLVAHQEDATRPTVAAASADTIVNAHEIVASQDLIADNNYAGWYVMSPADMGPEIEKWNAAYGYRGLAISEYGGGAIIIDHKQNLMNGEVKPRGPFQPEEWQALVHEGNYRAIKNHPVVWGEFIWLAFDSGGIRQPDGSLEGGNIKGLITQDRKTRKDAYYFYQANWTTEPMLYLTSRRDIHRTEATTPVKVYSNASCVTLTVNGKSYGTQSPDDVHAFHWKEIRLIPGDNHIEVSTPDGMHDEAIWTYQPQ